MSNKYINKIKMHFYSIFRTINNSKNNDWFDYMVATVQNYMTKYDIIL